jgi:hypothetical protein
MLTDTFGLCSARQGSVASVRLCHRYAGAFFPLHRASSDHLLALLYKVPQFSLHHPPARKKSPPLFLRRRRYEVLRRAGFSVGTGSRKRSPEFPFVSRLRQRRLLSLLMRQELYDTFDAYVRIPCLLGNNNPLSMAASLVKAKRWMVDLVGIFFSLFRCC